MRIPELLESTRFWFVVGLGNNPVPAAFGVAKFLKDHGKHIAPIYPRAEIVHCEPGFASISEAAQLWGPPDVVDLFLNRSGASRLSAQAVASGAKVLWMQLGVIDE